MGRGRLDGDGEMYDEDDEEMKGDGDEEDGQQVQQSTPVDIYLVVLVVQLWYATAFTKLRANTRLVLL